MTKPSASRLKVALVFAVLACVCGADAMAIEQMRQPLKSTSVPAVEDCQAIGDMAKKEECFATSPDFKGCLQTDRRCWPYKEMYALERSLKELNRELLSISAEKYNSYRDSAPTYLKDMEEYLRESEAAWRIYRDNDCYLEQYAQGMAEQEIPDIAESCRVQKTRDRIKGVKRLIESLN